jgi:hypothetical protein
METHNATIDYINLRKGDRIEADVVWNFYALLKPEVYQNWIDEHGNEDLAKAAHMPQTLVRVRDWIDARRNALDLPPLVINTKNTGLNVLNDEEASRYLSDRAFAGLRQHAKNTGRLIAAVDETQLSSAALREHESRVRTHSFVLASTHGAQTMLRKLRREGREAPKLK